MDVLAKFHKALAKAYPGLRFHLKNGNFKAVNSWTRVPQTAIVEYDRAGLTALGGNERTMRELLKPLLAKHGNHTTIRAIAFEQYVDPKRIAREAAETFAADFKALVLSGADDATLADKALELVNS